VREFRETLDDSDFGEGKTDITVRPVKEFPEPS